MENTAKNFALQLGSLIALYVSIGSLLALLFAVINVTYPDEAEGYYAYESASSAIRFSIAMLIVFFPAYAVLTRLVNRIRRSEQGTYLTLTKWLIYLSLLVGGSVLLGDLVATIHTFLNGELAIRFVLKALSVLIVVGAAFTYYVLDARGYWQAHEQKSITYGGVTAVIVICALILGFMNTETPQEVREMRLDEEQIRALGDMEWRIEEHYRINSAFPESIDEVYSGIEAPTAPEGRDQYEYRVVAEDAFELCAEFAYPSTPGVAIARPVIEGEGIKNPYNWDHGEGRWCFTRYIALLK